ncbi:STAS domain-containing protein [Methyloterricola oryzae]|uniref:STAS domain-containing protein n=1 Tax=Methyloterricola oryzae TaxID=1495050 RepID=UPI0005EAD393|nr:STAS domain-containing protein [Methyloterricola oryzae]
MKSPILKLGPNLIVSLNSEMTDSDLLELQAVLVAEVGRFRSKGVILEVTTLEVMDSFAARTLRNLAQAVGLRGAQAVIVGIRPEVALAMVQLGLEQRLSGVHTVLDLEEALGVLNREKAEVDPQ